MSTGARRRLLQVPAVENHHQYLVADYTDDGKTVRIGHTSF